MSKLAQTQFIATAQSTIVFGRALTDTEKSTMKDFQKEVIANGRMVGADVIDGSTYENRWTDINDATGYVAICNGFSPAPTASAAVAV